MSPSELIVVGAWAFIVSLFGGLVGLVLGNLRLPVVIAFATSPGAGAGANVAISGASALAAASAHVRGGRVSWSLFRWMAPTSLAGAIVGGLLSGLVPGDALLVVIGLIVLYGAYELARFHRPEPSAASEPAVAQLANSAWVGFGVGLLGGFVGLILGSMRLPAMVRYVGISPYAAVGTNAAVGVVVGIGGLVGHLPGGIDWGLFAAGCAGGVPGAFIGGRWTGSLDETVLLRVMAAILAVSGTAIIVQGLV